MSFLLGKGPSPAMVVASVALSFALAGSAIAGTEAVTSKLDKKEKRQVKRIAKQQANRQINKRAAGLRVAHAAEAESAANAASADNAAALGGDPPAAFQSRVRWVTVEADGGIHAQSGGITVSHPQTGIYFVDFGEPVGDKAAVATPMFSSPGGGTAIVAVPCAGGAVNPSCSAPFNGNPNVILVREDAASGAVNRAFSLALIP